jgi:hypothetical protein
VRIAERTPAAMPPLAEIRRDAERDWREGQNRLARESLYQRLRGRYQVVVVGRPAGDRVAQRDGSDEGVD